MTQHAENSADPPRDGGQERDPYDDEVYGDETHRPDDDDATEPLGGEVTHEGAMVPSPDTGTARPAEERGPDVYLDVPRLKVDQIDLDVEDLRARVSLQAEVLDLVKLNVGADVALGRVQLGISGVEAQAQLKVRLDNVAMIINRVLTTLDRNPQIVEDLVRRVGSAVQDVGQGAGYAVRDVGESAGSVVGAVGRSAGEAVGEVGQGVGDLVNDVDGSAGEAVGEVARSTGGAVGGAGDAARATGRAAGRAVRRTTGETGADETATRTAPRSRTKAGPATRRRRAADDEPRPTRPARRRRSDERDKPP
ncbi:hypothetical protein [Streptomyces sp. NPDC056600]|uniref:hypothetical protein n=1 Tax=Streptomyces sp. NPDC056600 TaxID=3345874 RepID=UPI0036CD7224